MIDSHLHLAQYPPEQIEKQIADWRANGITQVVAVATDLASSYRTLELKRRFPDFVHAAIGYHPEQPLPSEQELSEIFTLLHAERSQWSAIGEVGLPYYTLQEQGGEKALPRYVELLERFAALAVETNLPIILHAVHSQAQTVFHLLQQQGVAKAHFHWLKAPPDVVDQIVAAGYYISVTPEVCYRERDQQLASQVPVERLLLETDGPWPYQGPFAGLATTPLFLFQAAEQVAARKGMPLEPFAAQITANVQACYGKMEAGLQKL